MPGDSKVLGGHGSQQMNWKGIEVQKVEKLRGKGIRKTLESPGIGLELTKLFDY